MLEVSVAMAHNPAVLPVVRFPMRCQSCRQPVTVICLDVGGTGRVEWECPYLNCRARDGGYLCGKVLDVIPGWSDADRATLES
jgi:hypothetical protein